MKNSSLWIILYRMRIPFIVIIVTYTIAIIGMLIIDSKDLDGNTYHLTIFDAFYFITYTATTIGFGESPFIFTYAQKLWVTFSIYLTVLGWFYGIGTLVSLLQDKLLIHEIRRSKFKRDIKNLRGKFIIILGYNNISAAIIKKAMEFDIRTVVIEENEVRVNELILENYTPPVPILTADAQNKNSLLLAGVCKINCKAIVSLFDDEKKNLKIAIFSRLLNKNLTLAIKSSSYHQTQNLKDLETQIIANPFAIISHEMNLAFTKPNILKLEKWIYKIENLSVSLPSFPSGNYIICGFGRMGKYIFSELKNSDIKLVFIDIKANPNKIENLNLIIGDADDREILIKAGIKNSSAIIAATNDDTVNLSILSTAKRLNENIITIARENELDDFSIFNNAKIDHIFMPQNILIHKTTNALINPLSDMFVHEMAQENDKWAYSLITQLIKQINEKPILFELSLDEYDGNEVAFHLFKKRDISLKIFHTSLHNRNLTNNVVPLLLIRDKKRILLPSWDTMLKLEDEILFACDSHAKSDIEYISQNPYEFEYAYTGYEKSTIYKRFFKNE